MIVVAPPLDRPHCLPLPSIHSSQHQTLVAKLIFFNHIQTQAKMFESPAGGCSRLVQHLVDGAMLRGLGRCKSCGVSEVLPLCGIRWPPIRQGSLHILRPYWYNIQSHCYNICTICGNTGTYCTYCVCSTKCCHTDTYTHACMHDTHRKYTLNGQFSQFEKCVKYDFSGEAGTCFMQSPLRELAVMFT